MLPDGLTKGAIDRQALLSVISSNYWKQVGDRPCELSAFVQALAEMISDDISSVALEWLTIRLGGELASRAVRGCDRGVRPAYPDSRDRDAVLNFDDPSLERHLRTSPCRISFLQ